MPTIRNFTPVQINGVDTQQHRIEYDASGYPIYDAYALTGESSATASKWNIHKYTWSSGTLVSKQFATGSWDLRATYTYA